jgi:hypothetical protein
LGEREREELDWVRKREREMRIISGTILLSLAIYIQAIDYEKLNTLSITEMEQLTLSVRFSPLSSFFFDFSLSLFLSLSLS